MMFLVFLSDRLFGRNSLRTCTTATGHIEIFREYFREGPYGEEENCGVRDPRWARAQAPFRVGPEQGGAWGDEPLLRGGAQQDLSGALGARAGRVGGARGRAER